GRPEIDWRVAASLLPHETMTLTAGVRAGRRRPTCGGTSTRFVDDQRAIEEAKSRVRLWKLENVRCPVAIARVDAQPRLERREIRRITKVDNDTSQGVAGATPVQNSLNSIVSNNAIALMICIVRNHAYVFAYGLPSRAASSSSPVPTFGGGGSGWWRSQQGLLSRGTILSLHHIDAPRGRAVSRQP